MTDKIKIGIYY